MNQDSLSPNSNDNRNCNQYILQVFVQPILREGAKGKEKGVFSKKQLLILFDLLSETNAIERIDFHKPNKFPDIATLFHALTGKAASSFTKELDDRRHKDIYQFHTAGERDQLIVALTNLANIFRAAGFRSIAKQADKKIKEIEASPPDFWHS
jgi:hypothetical protein